MTLLTSHTASTLWQDVVKDAENQCSILLDEELEAYLVGLLTRYTNRPEIVQQIFASAFLEGLALNLHQRHLALRDVGDQCLLFSGLFYKSANKRNVKISYFVDIGRTAYTTISKENALFGLLAFRFVLLTDVLQSIRHDSDLLPLEAYEQWSEIGSQRAFKILQTQTKAIPMGSLKSKY